MKFSSNCMIATVALVAAQQHGVAAFTSPSQHSARFPSTQLDVTTLDEWQVLENGSVVGSVRDHPSLSDGDIITTSPLSNPNGAKTTATVTTLTGSKYRLGKPMELAGASFGAESDMDRREFGELGMNAFALSGLFGVGLGAGITLSGGLGKGLSVPEAKIAMAFPNALPNAEFIKRVTERLSKYGYGKNSLVATSLCCDEVNRPLEKDLAKVYDEPFVMGGLAGFPFGGVTSFGAMAHHIPDGGSCLVVFGPHVGVDSYGSVGTVNRRGRAKGGACCGSAAAALGKIRKGQMPPMQDGKPLPATDSLDAQQAYVDGQLAPYAERLLTADDRNVELPYALYDAQRKMMDNIVDKGCGAMEGNGSIALMGGIQINTPDGLSDYFLPLNFELLNSKGKLVKNLMWS
mmetsp:Transcript_16979/g.47007  ORF Transcript_16979/g.47007 Transcript_16979/m.47007 type:complete len:404 (-) Transcript_16979:359-1570(-)